jgi:hypothetical protein
VPDVWRIVPRIGAATCLVALIGQTLRWVGVFGGG